MKTFNRGGADKKWNGPIHVGHSQRKAKRNNSRISTFNTLLK